MVMGLVLCYDYYWSLYFNKTLTFEITDIFMDAELALHSAKYSRYYVRTMNIGSNIFKQHVSWNWGKVQAFED